MKIVVFDIWGDLGHFRVPYTTSSPITFPVPTKTSLYGIIGAFLGYHKDEYLERIADNNWKFGISIKKPISKIYIPENFIDTKRVKMFARMPKGKPSRTQINIEFLKSPYFRIFASSDSIKALSTLENLLKEHKSVYTISLGISECIANFKYIGTFEGERIENNNNFIEISTIVPLDYIKKSNAIDFTEQGKKFLKIHLPVEMSPQREVIETKDFLVEANGLSIKAKLQSYIRVKDENIILF